MKKDVEKRNIIISMAITILLIVWLIMSVGCATPTQRKLEEPGHWPGWIIEKHPPLYGPHATQVQLRNAYSDGWQDRGEAMRNYGM